MDWDDETFSREEITSHYDALGILENHDIPDLLTRSTENTRTGNEFSFKLCALTIGVAVGQQFYCGFNADVASHGVNIHSKKRRKIPSSFWMRFGEQWFQIRAFCSGYDSDNTSFSPYECRIPFRDVIPGGIQLRAQYHEECERVTVQLSIKARHPPRYTHRLPNVAYHGKELIYDRHATEADFFGYLTSEVDAGVIQAVEDHRLDINVGLWNIHRVTLDVSTWQYKIIWMCMVRFRMMGLRPDFDDATRPELDPMPTPSWCEYKIQRLMNRQSFPIRYLVEALSLHGRVSLAELDELFALLSRIPSSRQQSILEGLFAWTRSGTITADLIEVARRIPRPRPLDAHLVLTRRCLITPTKCILMPPVAETSNSMLRRFKEYEDRFLRVQFVDEDGDFPIKGETLVIDDILQGTEGVFARIRRALTFGVFIAGRHYVFATFSESQVRERACWMIAETGNFTVGSILRWMGDLETERVVAKHAARQSLALSSTRAVQIPIKFTRGYPDIKRNGFTFTDGAGQCTQKVADECARVVGHTLTPVSAVQFRDGGVKGVLSVVNDPSLEEYEIRERGSMIKIQSENREFGVLKVATYSTATLNRQCILLMEAQGVPTQTLLDIFWEAKLAIEGLEHGFAPDRLAAVTTFPLTQAFEHQVTEDPFVENIVDLVKCRLLSELKWKAWIEIPESAFLMGIPDETNSLDEGEVFCQIHPPHGEPQIITKQCLIYRNPCLHPGDVRIVRAVDAPALRHLRNVIVFNVRGQRDLPNMLSGGDLDGDTYSLIWDPRLIIPNVHRPMDYTAPTPDRCDMPVTIEQTKEHFVDFIKNDVLGRICNTHLAVADQFGPQDQECLDLAELASKAVDFGKTGVPVLKSELPLEVEEYPDFMGKEFKSIRVFKKEPIMSYPSENALGRMFRAIDPEPEFHRLEETDWTAHGDPRLLAYENVINYQVYLEEAAKQKIIYEFELEGLLRRYNISEAECVAGLLLRSPKTRVRIEKDYDIRIAVRDAYARVVAGAKDRIDQHLDTHPSGPSKDLDMRAWALAAYKIIYDCGDRFAIYQEAHLASFDYYFDEDLVDEEIAEEFKSLVAGKVFASLGRRYSFAWLLSSEIFDLLREVDESSP